MPVDLVGGRVEERVLLVGAARGDAVGRDDPDRHAFLPAGVDVAGVAERHLGVGRVQAADVHMGEAALGPDEHLPQRPLVRGRLMRRRPEPSRAAVLGGVGARRLADPGAVVVGPAAVGHALPVARAVALMTPTAR